MQKELEAKAAEVQAPTAAPASVPQSGTTAGKPVTGKK